MTRSPQSSRTISCSLYHPSAVRLRQGPFLDAVNANRRYMLALDADRLLAPFRREAGLSTTKPSYGNWESIGLDGHTAGHYLSALSWMISAGHDTRTGALKSRLASMITSLAECQTAGKSGYIGGVPGSTALWLAVANGNIDAIFDKWVPWYNIHKTFAGLRDAYLIGGIDQARDILVRLTDWTVGVLSGLNDQQLDRMLNQEHGGMNEVLADVYAITGNQEHLDAAKRFCHKAILDPLLRGEDTLTGLHANTQIPKVIGFARIAALTDNKAWMQAAAFFHKTVTSRRSVAFGGNSVSEHFNPVNDFRMMIEHREGPETCNSYNMLRLTELLHTSAPDAKQVDWYERTLYNHILASIEPNHPGFVYFTPVRPGHYRVYSTPQNCFWCCVGSGMENPGRYNAFIYARRQDGIAVNLFIASDLTDDVSGVRLRQETRFPDASDVTITVRESKGVPFALYIRIPSWTDLSTTNITVNEIPVPVTPEPDGYLKIDRAWRKGDTISLQLSMTLRSERIPDGSPWLSFLYGPVVLAASAGTKQQDGLFAADGRGDHIAHGPLRALDKAVMLTESDLDPAKSIVADFTSGPLQFTMPASITADASGGDVALKPFFRMHRQRYQLVFEQTSKAGLAERRRQLKAAEDAALRRDRLTLDVIAIGEQQPEVDHQLSGDGLETGVFDGRRWRHGKVVAYTLSPRGEKQIDLEVTYNGIDSGRSFDIFVNDTKLVNVVLNGGQPGKWLDVRYAIPDTLLTGNKNQTLRIRFVATQWLAGGLYGIRLIKRG